MEDVITVFAVNIFL